VSQAKAPARNERFRGAIVFSQDVFPRKKGANLYAFKKEWLEPRIHEDYSSPHLFINARNNNTF